MSQDDNARSRVTQSHIDLLKRRRAAAADIRDGRLPTLKELYQGTGFAHGDIKTDIRLWCKDLLLEISEADAAERLQQLHDTCSANALADCLTAFEHHDEYVTARIDFYLAAEGDQEARQRVVCRMLDTQFGRIDRSWVRIPSRSPPKTS